MDRQGDIIFTLDIGTRTVIGLVMEYKDNGYQILASEVVEHEERAMLDGQIHNVKMVADQVARVKESLENKTGIQLERVAIAAAGRALETIDYEQTIDLEEKRLITEEDVQSLEFSAIQKAQKQLAVTDNHEEEDQNYHFVGYSVREYCLDGMTIANLEGQRGRKMKVKIIATFLPRIVVDSLLTVINKTGLEVEYLTLEPIAAADVVIPKNMYNFNLALVDIGAGTSDIALTRGGSMIAYAMVPVAGDEITEALAEEYLLDYNTGEMIKRSLIKGEARTVRNILSQEVTVETEEALAAIDSVVQSLASQISEAILMLNEKSPQAVICIGGGSLTPNLLDYIAKFLEIDKSRVGIKEYSDIKNVIGEVEKVVHAQANTPIGIAISSHLNRRKPIFIDVQINGIKHQVFTLNKATVADALLAADINFRKLQGTPGMGITCTVNGEMKVIRGEMGKPGWVLLNGEEISDFEEEIQSGDEIEFIAGKSGKDASGVIGDVIPEIKTIKLYINGEKVVITPEILQDGEKVDYNTPIKDGADIHYNKPETIRDVLPHLFNKKMNEFNNDFISYTFNGEEKYIPRQKFLILNQGEPVDLDIPLKDGMKLQINEIEKNEMTVQDVVDVNIEEYIPVVFNGNQLSIPVRGEIYCNGNKVNGDRMVKNGDKIEYKKGTVSVEDIFEHVNYKVSPFFKNFRITINGNKAGLDDNVQHGDKLEMVYDKENRYINKR